MPVSYAPRRSRSCRCLAGAARALPRTPLQFRPDVGHVPLLRGPVAPRGLPLVPARDAHVHARRSRASRPSCRRTSAPSRSPSAAPAGAERTPAYDQTITFRYAVGRHDGARSPSRCSSSRCGWPPSPGEYEVDMHPPAGRGQHGSARSLNADVCRPTPRAAGTALSGIQLATSIAAGDRPDGPAREERPLDPPQPRRATSAATARRSGTTPRSTGRRPRPRPTRCSPFIAESASGTALPDHEQRPERRPYAGRRRRRPARHRHAAERHLLPPPGRARRGQPVRRRAEQARSSSSTRTWRRSRPADEMSYEETLFAAMGEEELAQRRLRRRHRHRPRASADPRYRHRRRPPAPS